jgi:hypothetical protein
MLTSRDTGVLKGYVVADDPHTTPRFFDWTKQDTRRPPSTLLHTGPRYAWLAKRWEVGIWENLDTINVSHQGHLLTEPANILQILSKKSQKMWLKNLEERVMTVHKPPVPPFDVSWGIAGRPDQYRPHNMAFMKPGSNFSDSEIRILLGLRLRLWPTPYVHFVRSHGLQAPECNRCGSFGTYTHYLNIPPSDTAHSPLLRSIPQGRHADLVRTVGQWLLQEPVGHDWKIVLGENLPVHPDFDHVRQAINDACARGALGADVDAPQHHKPDLLLARGPRTARIYLNVDLTGGSDDKLIIEDVISKSWIRPRGVSQQQIWQSNWFDSKGCLTRIGRDALTPEQRPEADKLTDFKQARYPKRYEGLERTLVETESGCTAKTIVIAIGVAGWIPDFSRKSMESLKPTSTNDQVYDKLRNVVWRSAIMAFKAWRAEG